MVAERTVSEEVRPDQVHATLGRSMLADGLPIVFDAERSRGAFLHDARSGRDLLDFFGFFGSLPLGYNHPHMCEPEWLAELARWAIQKPSNSDVYSVPFAQFVRTFTSIAMPPEMKHLFLISGGALAVENALKAAFDWKSRLNRARGRAVEADLVIHLQGAFHGRSGYTLSLTNTDPLKTDLFPKFPWPRVPAPYCEFPQEGANLARGLERQEQCLDGVRKVLARDAERTAAIILEPIQCEGGDRHLLPGCLTELRALADEHDVLLVFDEVQTGFGGTGRWWCYQHLGVEPDLVAFGKKAQICGFMAGRRIDVVPENVFHVKSRINSTWGGDLVDMIRSTRVLEIYRDESILDNARERGAQLLAGLERLVAEFPTKVGNARGRGLLAALTIHDQKRARAISRGLEEGILLLTCGPDSIRFRPALDIRAESIDDGLRRLHRIIESL